MMVRKQSNEPIQIPQILSKSMAKLDKKVLGNWNYRSKQKEKSVEQPMIVEQKHKVALKVSNFEMPEEGSLVRHDSSL